MKKKIIIPIVSAIVLVIGVAVGVVLVRQNQELRTQAAPATNLSLSPSNPIPDVGDTFTVDVNMTTNENIVVAAKVELEYDPDRLQVVDVTKGTLFPNPDVLGPTIDNILGSLLYELRTPIDQDPVQGSGQFAVVTFKAIDSGTAVISFGDNTIIGSSQESFHNTLASANPVTINIQAAASPSPTASPTGSPSPTITATPITELPDTAEVTPTLILGGTGVLLLLVGAFLFAI